jgi:hypothetical protein
MRNRWEDWFQPGEMLLWEGAPSPGFRQIPRNILLGLFGLPFLGAGLFTCYFGLTQIFSGNLGGLVAGIFVGAFGSIFVLVGGAMVFGTWLEEILAPRHIRYALMNRNGYIASRTFGRKMEVLPIHSDTRVETQENSDGTLSVYFHFETARDSDGDQRTDKKGFERLANGHDVYRVIRDLQSAHHGAPQ